MINIIVAVSNERERVIGKDNKLLLHNKEDLQEFKRLTSQPNSVLVCGRKTFESLPKDLRKELVESSITRLEHDRATGVKNLYINNCKEDQEIDEIPYGYFIIIQQDKSVFRIKVILLTPKRYNN